MRFGQLGQAANQLPIHMKPGTDRGINPGTDPRSGSPHVNPGTDRRTLTPERIAAGTDRRGTDPRNGSPERIAGTDRRNGSPERIAGRNGSPANPGTDRQNIN